MTKKRENLKKAIVTSIILVVADIVVLYLGTSNPNFSLVWAIGGIGAITFFGTLMLANMLSKTRFLNKGEMRKAIAASITVVYFILVSLSICKDCEAEIMITDTMIDHFTYIVGIVIAFYFGARAVEAIKGNNDGQVQLDEVDK